MGRSLLLAGLAWLVWVGSAAAAWEPPGWRPAAAATDIAPGPSNPAAVALGWAVRAYQVTASRVDSDRCPSHPSCSAYARQALAEHGPLLGVALTAARLIGEGSEAAFSPSIRVDGQWKIYAPVRNDLAFLGYPLEP